MKRELVIMPETSAGQRTPATEPEEQGFLSADQLLTRLPISRGTLRNWCADGSIPYIATPGRRILFDWPSVRAAMLRRQRGGVQ